MENGPSNCPRGAARRALHLQQRSISKFRAIFVRHESLSFERERIVQRACSASPLDAAYLIADFNRRCWMIRQSPIHLEEIIKGLNAVEPETLKRKANALHTDEVYFGEEHWTGKTREEIYEEMKRRHPGFGRKSYELALHRGIITTR